MPVSDSTAFLTLVRKLSISSGVGLLVVPVMIASAILFACSMAETTWPSFTSRATFQVTSRSVLLSPEVKFAFTSSTLTMSLTMFLTCWSCASVR